MSLFTVDELRRLRIADQAEDGRLRAQADCTESQLLRHAGITPQKLDELTRCALARPSHRIHRIGTDRWRLSALRAAAHRRRQTGASE
jgi:hypothetical protein